jgi:predicted lipoprotein with Yx(FWY)xxD motif
MAGWPDGERRVEEMQMSQGRSRWSKFALGATALIAVTALTAAACSSSTSDKDKTATAAAKGGSTPAATTAATKAATTPAATAVATKAASTPAAAATTAATKPSGTTAGSVKVAESALGKILVDAAGFTLYTFKSDVAGNGKSAAEGLTAAWPPLALSAAPADVTGATGAWALFERADGKPQITYKGLPLYYFVNDKAPGDTKGDKLGDVWFVAVP